MDDPTPVGKCLGRKHIVTEHVIDGHKVRAMEYDVCDFMKQCVTAYKEACRKPNMELRRVDTPFIQTIDGDCEGGGNGVMAQIASAILMNIVYGARLARLGSIQNHPTSRVTRYQMV